MSSKKKQKKSQSSSENAAKNAAKSASKKASKTASPKSSPRDANAEAIDPGEDRAAVAATVAWMLTALATGLAQITAVAILGLHRVLTDDPEKLAAPLKMLPRLLFFVALIAGLTSIILTPIVYRFRKTPPPRSITTFVVVIALIPFVVMLFLTA